MLPESSFIHFMNSSCKQRITVLHILSSAGIAGGERYVLDLLKYADKSIKHLVVLPYRGPFAQVLRDCKHNFSIVDMKKRFSIRSILLLVQFMKNNGVHIVHTHGYRAGFYGRVACVLAGVKSVSTVHVSLYDYVDTPLLIRSIYILLERMLSCRNSKFICISDAMKDDMLRLGIKPEKIVVIRNGIDLERFRPRPSREQISREIGIKENAPVIGTVGRMVTEKGQIYLIEALKYLKTDLKGLKCLFVGEGPMLSQLRKMASDSGIGDMCVFTGVRNDIESIYPLLLLFVLPSIREPFGLVLLEAMASGVPVIATDSGGPSEFIKSGINGVLVPPRDSKALASQISCLLSNNDKRMQIGRNGLRTAEKKFSVKKTAKKIEEIYFSIHQQNNRSRNTHFACM